MGIVSRILKILSWSGFIRFCVHQSVIANTLIFPAPSCFSTSFPIIGLPSVFLVLLPSQRGSVIILHTRDQIKYWISILRLVIILLIFHAAFQNERGCFIQARRSGHWLIVDTLAFGPALDICTNDQRPLIRGTLPRSISIPVSITLPSNS